MTEWLKISVWKQWKKTRFRSGVSFSVALNFNKLANKTWILSSLCVYGLTPICWIIGQQRDQSAQFMWSGWMTFPLPTRVWILSYVRAAHSAWSTAFVVYLDQFIRSLLHCLTAKCDTFHFCKYVKLWIIVKFKLVYSF